MSTNDRRSAARSSLRTNVKTKGTTGSVRLRVAPLVLQGGLKPPSKVITSLPTDPDERRHRRPPLTSTPTLRQRGQRNVRSPVLVVVNGVPGDLPRRCGARMFAGTQVSCEPGEGTTGNLQTDAVTAVEPVRRRIELEPHSAHLSGYHVVATEPHDPIGDVDRTT